jgi:hypothetical protein
MTLLHCTGCNATFHGGRRLIGQACPGTDTGEIRVATEAEAIAFDALDALDETPEGIPQ